MEFEEIEEEELPHTVQSFDCFTLCPTMDLASFKLSDHVIWVYRKGNEKVWDIELSSDDSIKDLIWKPDGKKFAVLTESGDVELYNTMNGELIRLIQLNDTQITCSKWCKRELGSKSDIKSLNGILDNISIIDSLPLLDVNIDETNDNLNDIISTKTNNIEAKSTLDFLIVGSNIGCISWIFSGIFKVENWRLPDEYENCEIFKIESNDTFSNYYLLVKDTINNNKLSLLKLDVKFTNDDTNELSQILVICSNLLNLNDIVTNAVTQINNYYKPYFEYTIRIIELLRGEIEDDQVKENDENKETGTSRKSKQDPIYDLYDLLLTGSLSNATKKWLTDYLSDRGVKRWTKLGRTYFNNARQTVYNKLILPMHHLIVYLTDLKGLCQWNSTLLDVMDIENCMKIAENFLKYCFRFMIEINDSQRCFEQMILWLSSILSEITADEKLNVSYKVKDITKYLLFIGSKLNTMNSKDKTIHNDYKINEFSQLLDIELNILFEKIRSDIKSCIKLENVIDVSNDYDTLEIKHLNLKIVNDQTGYVYMLVDKTIRLLEFNVDTMEFQEQKIDTAHSIKDIKLISDSELIVLTDKSLLVYKITEGKLALQKQQTFEKHGSHNNDSFKAGCLVVNDKKNLLSVLDENRKKYVWMKY